MQSFKISSTTDTVQRIMQFALDNCAYKVDLSIHVGVEEPTTYSCNIEGFAMESLHATKD